MHKFDDYIIQDCGNRWPISFAQEFNWKRYEATGFTTNVSIGFRISGPVSIASMEHAIGAVISRHKILSRRFCTDSNGIMLEESSASRFPGIQIEGAPHGITGEVDHENLRDQLFADANQTFDWRQDFLFRARLYLLGKNSSLLLISLPHVITDQVSMDVLSVDLWAAYDAIASGHRWKPPPLSAHFGDYTRWQQQLLLNGKLDDRLLFWKNYRGTPAELDSQWLNKPFSRNVEFADSHSLHIVRVGFDSFLPVPLSIAARKLAATSEILINAALIASLCKWTGFHDITNYVLNHGRISNKLWPLIGLFAHYRLLRTDLSGNPDIREIIRRVRDATLEGWKNDVLGNFNFLDTASARSHWHPVINIILRKSHSAPTPYSRSCQVKKFGIGIKQRRMDRVLVIKVTGSASGLVAEASYDPVAFDRTCVLELIELFRNFMVEALVTMAPERASSDAKCIST